MEANSTQNKKLTDPSWKPFHKIAGIAALVSPVLFIFDLVIWVFYGPEPATAESWFNLLLNERWIGIGLLYFPTLAGMLLYLLVFVALYSVLESSNQAFSKLALVLALVGLTILLITNMAHAMMYLSDRYAIATSNEQRSALLAAGEMLIANVRHGSNLGGFFIEGSALIFSLIMLRSTVFKKVTAYLGIIGHGLDFARITLTLIFVPENLTAILLMIGGLPQFIWLVLVGLKLTRPLSSE